MKSQWFKGVSEKDKEKVRKEIKYAKPALDRLITILEDRIQGSVKEMSQKVHLKEAASIEDMVAYYLGEQEALRSVKTLLDIED